MNSQHLAPGESLDLLIVLEYHVLALIQDDVEGLHCVVHHARGLEIVVLIIVVLVVVIVFLACQVGHLISKIHINVLLSEVAIILLIIGCGEHIVLIHKRLLALVLDLIEALVYGVQ